MFIASGRRCWWSPKKKASGNAQLYRRNLNKIARLWCNHPYRHGPVPEERTRKAQHASAGNAPQLILSPVDTSHVLALPGPTCCSRCATVRGTFEEVHGWGKHCHTRADSPFWRPGGG